jgi:hypothetical protein
LLPDFLGHVPVARVQLLQLRRKCVNVLEDELFLVEPPLHLGIFCLDDLAGLFVQIICLDMGKIDESGAGAAPSSRQQALNHVAQRSLQKFREIRLSQNEPGIGGHVPFIHNEG